MSRQDRHEHDRAMELAASAIDYRLTAAQTVALNAHLVVCSACARSAAAMRGDAIALRPWTTPLPSRRVDDAVFAAIAGRRATAPSLLILVAAALLLVALLGVAATAGSLLLRTWWTPPTMEVAPSPAVVADASPGTTPTLTSAPSPAATASESPSPVPSPLAAARWGRVPDQAAFADAGMWAVAASPDLYVAVGWTGNEPGAAGVAWISADGRDWRRVSIPSAEHAAPRGIIYDRLGFVAWGFDTSAPASRAVIWMSPDGVTWQRASDIPSFEWVDIAGIARLGERLVAVGSNSSSGPSFLAWTSDDGRAWRPVSGTESISATPNALAATGTAVVAPGGEKTVIRSTNGLQWETVTSPELGGFMEDVVGSGGGFVGVGTGPSTGEAGSPPAPATAWTSTDGRTWLQSALEPSSLGWMHLVAAHGSEYIALGEGFGPTFAYRSTDGLTWVEMSTAPDTTLEGRVAGACTGGPCSYRTFAQGLADGPLGPIAVGRTELKSGGYQAVVWILQ